MRTSGFILFLVGLAATALTGELPVTVEDSGSKEVDTLVVQLVSKHPAPYRSGYSGEAPYLYMTPEVEAATQKLKQMGPSIFPALVKHLGDDRYSYSSVSAAWGNFSVGDSVIDILSDGHYMHSGYKARKTPSGYARYLSFKDYIESQKPEPWAERASHKTRLAIQEDFIGWCVAEEQKRGFIDEDQRKHILGVYSSARESVTREYSEPGGAANGSQPIRSETNRTPSAAGSGR